MKKITIIILSYNLLEDTTKPCIESIYSTKTKTDFEVVVVDNCSTDETIKYLQNIDGLYPNLRIILNSQNFGFPKGNNIGISSSDAEFYILLNSDTIVTDNWLDNMLAFMEQHKEVGMLGPVSNNVWNSQKILIESYDDDKIIELGKAYAQKYKDDYFYTNMLGFFCVFIRKEVIEKVGLLDEDYGLGTFEDDDYSLRVLNCGYKLACLEGVFIFHKGSLSFKNTNITGLSSLNRTIFERKFNSEWKTSWRPETFTDCISQYLNRLDAENYNWIREKINMKLNIIKTFNNNELELQKINNELLDKKNELLNLKNELLNLKNELLNLKNELQNAYNSQKWKIGNFIYKLFLKTHTLVFIKALILIKRKGLVEFLKQTKNKLFLLFIRAKIRFFNSYYKNQLKKILAANKNQAIIIFPPLVDWHIQLFQRPQHIASNISKSGFLYFYCTPNYIDKVSGFYELSKNCYLTNRTDLLLEIPDKKIVHLYSTDTGLTMKTLYKYLCNGDLVLYEYIDEIHEDISGPIPESTKIVFQEILRNENIMVVSSADKLFNDVSKFRNKNHILVTNGVDYQHFSQNFTINEIPDEIFSIVKEGKPIIGYYGALAKWTDYELIIKLASEHPEYNILLIGVNYNKDPKWENIENKNISYIGAIDYKELPQYAYWFDVSMIPFKVNEITESTSPIKLFEYMALGKPIVTSGMRECRKYKSVFIGETHEDFINLIDKALQVKNDKEYKKTLLEEALNNTWETKAIKIADLIQKNISKQSNINFFQKFNYLLNDSNPNFYYSIINQFQSDKSLTEKSLPNIKMWVEFSLSTNDRGRITMKKINEYKNIKDSDYCDIGCAYGGFLVAASEIKARYVYGIDLNPRLLELAKKILLIITLILALQLKILLLRLTLKIYSTLLILLHVMM